MKAIVGHSNTDFDCLASMAAAHKLYPDYMVVIPASAERHVREYLHQQGYPCPFIWSQKLTEPITDIVIVDNADLTRTDISSDFLSDCSIVAVYDHHPKDDTVKADLYTHKQCGANITLMTEILLAKGIPITREEAVLFILGLYEDTGYFTYVSTTADDIDTLRRLFDIAGDVSAVSRFLVTDFSKEQLSIMDDLVETADMLNVNEGTIAVCCAERDGYVDNAAFVVQHLLFMLNVDAVFAVMQMGTGVYIIGRSRSHNLSIRDVLRQLGGGGHPSAGYVHVSGISIVEIKEKLYDTLEQLKLTGRTITDIMTSNVVTVHYNDSVARVKEKMLAYNHGKIPVVDEQGRIFGIMYQKEVDRLLNHNFSQESIREFVAHDMAVCEEDDPLYHAKRLFWEGKGIILVVNKERVLTGIVTKTDLLKTEEQTMSESVKKNIASELRYHTKTTLFEHLQRIGAIAESMGFTAYLVGGFVRDLFLRLETYDVDIVIEGKGIDVAQAAAEEFGATLVVHKKFQTATLSFPDGTKLDVATARSETYEKPASLPTVMLSPLKYDLYRRDFTINAMAVSLAPLRFGELVDYFGGFTDLKNGVLKTLHTVSFIEDPTRVFRGIRFAARFDFRFSKQTHSLLKNALSLGVLNLLTGRRIKDELMVMFDEDYPEYCCQKLGNEGILHALFEGCKFGAEKEKLFREIRHVHHWYKLLYMKKSVNKYFLYFLALFEEADIAAVTAFSQRLELTKRFTTIALQVRQFMQQHYRTLSHPQFLKKSAIYRMFHSLETESILFLMACHAKNERFQQYASLYFIDLHASRSLVNGTMLQEMGIPYGVDIKTILEDIHVRYIDGEFTTLDDAVRYVHRQYLNNDHDS